MFRTCALLSFLPPVKIVTKKRTFRVLACSGKSIIAILHHTVLHCTRLWLEHLARQGGWQPWRETWETEPGTTADSSRGGPPSHQRQIKFGLGVASSKKTESCGSWQREGPPNTSLLWHNLKCLNCFSGKIPSANIIFPLSLSKLSSPEGNLILSQNSIRELNTNSWKSSNDVKRDFRSFFVPKHKSQYLKKIGFLFVHHHCELHHWTNRIRAIYCGEKREIFDTFLLFLRKLGHIRGKIRVDPKDDTIIGQL